MKHKLLLSAFIAALFASCSTAYRATQTPDDVYYSPTHAVTQKNDEDDNDDRRKDRYEDYSSSEDRYLRMKVRDRSRWSRIDDYDYWYDTRYSCNTVNYYKNNWAANYNWGGCSCACTSTSYNSIFYPGYYNPYYSPFYGYPGTAYIIKNPRVSPNINRPQLGGYTNGGYNNNNTLGNSIKKVFAPNNNGYSNRNSRSDNSTYKSTERVYTPSSSSSSSSGSSSGSSGSSSSGSSRPARSGRN